ncbi:hypothetical protein K3556_13890 [Aliiroseovarius sp. M344]|uniref:hypothetical protein n=1 Tax=Aliiroseovarius sp. M344 TaxID=2867010 RepID=UPI0021ADD391|nr:hypothetical protein [Aliiroseovarius sp. M344]UWQ13999.1 hypothetical protein K3556_13890 [Aliiroseovarius sp. M344]
MSLPITRERLAQALSVVGEAGLDGMEYASAVNALMDGAYVSNKARWTLKSSPSFTSDEFRVLMAYAAREDLVEAGEDTARLAVGQYHSNTWTLNLTLKGFEYVQDYDTPVLHRWGTNIRENLPTVVLSVLAALAMSWAVYKFGAPQ